MAAAAASSMMPPARILDLDVEVLTDSRQLEFSWTAPGEDFDQGKRQNWIHLIPVVIFPVALAEL